MMLDPQASGSEMLIEQRGCDFYDRVDDLNGPKIFGLFETGDIRKHFDVLERTFDLFAGRRKVNELENVLIYEFAELALRGLMYQNKWFPMSRLPSVFTNRMVREEFIENCHCEHTKEELEKLSLFSFTQARRELLPAKRFLQILEHPEIAARDGFDDPLSILQNSRTVVISGGKASRQARYMHLLRWLYAGIEYAEHFGPILILLDEATNYGRPDQGFFTEHVRNAMRTQGKHGFQLVAITQTLASLAQEIRDEIVDSCHKIICYRVVSPATVKMMAEILCEIDPHLESHRDTSLRSIPDGYDSEGKPFHHQFTEERVHYRSFAEQRLLMEQSLRRLKVGERYVSGVGFEKARKKVWWAE